MKTCTKCNTPKPPDEFHRDKSRKDGRFPHCKLCAIKHVSEWQKANPEKRAPVKAKWQKANPQKGAAATMKWYAAHYTAYRAKNRNALNAWQSQWKRNNTPQVNASTARRRAGKMRATPVWANGFFIQEAYRLAKLRTKVTGFEWQVDHVVPLRSKLVCGLHVENNLQVIPALHNQSKGNRYWPGMPEIEYGR